jgi:hypothetical protein
MTIIIVKGQKTNTSMASQCPDWIRYNLDTKSRTVFVSVNDAQSTKLVLTTLDKMKVNSIIAKHEDHPDFKTEFGRVEIFDENNYFDAFIECVIGILDVDSILSKAIYYGLPCLVLTNNTNPLNYCVPIELNEGIIETRVSWLMDNEYQRECLSRMALNEYSR